MLRAILTDPCCVAALVAAAGIGLWQAGVWLVSSIGENIRRTAQTEIETAFALHRID